MPVYQYACTECGEQLEVRQSFTDDALTVCPVCEGRLRKVLSAVGVVFKGSGFYRTDSRAGASGTGKPAEATTNGSSGTSAASESSGSSGGSESSPAPTSSGGSSSGGSSSPSPAKAAAS